uniref:Uncharacterized protein n=1 Tax=Eutreptiella gymnastica TaxID=73025 RepID=A0A7S1IYV0_9EUGL|mmetsp:Transcript_54844/g.97610  ORF Transcript_54844/g.97610 Transcript_54844/m.97610 type:complete len:239 (+) Transcript_54844:1-717(+)
MGPGFRVLCVNVIACGLYCNALLTVQYLQHKGVLATVVQTWLAMVQRLTRRYDRKLTAVAFTHLLQAAASSPIPEGCFSMEVLAEITAAAADLIVAVHVQGADHVRPEEEEEDSESGSDSGMDEECESDEEDEWDHDWEEDEEDRLASPAVGADCLDSAPRPGPGAPGATAPAALDAELPDGEFDSPISRLRPSLVFRDVMAQICARHPQTYAQLTARLSDQIKAQLEAAVAADEAKC